MGSILSGLAAILLSAVYAVFIYIFLTIFRKQHSSVIHVFFTLCGAWLGVLVQIILTSVFYDDYTFTDHLDVVIFLGSFLVLIIGFSVLGYLFATKFYTQLAAQAASLTTKK